MSTAQIRRFCRLDGACAALLGEILEKQQLSMRAYFRIIKVARSIADLAGSADIRQEHILEAASFRLLDRVEFL